MTDIQHEERERSFAAQVHGLTADNARLESRLKATEAERNALLYSLSVNEDTGTLCHALRDRAVELEAAVSVAEKRIRDLEAAGTRHAADRTRLEAIRAYVNESLGASQMMRPVSLVLQRVHALLGDENDASAKAGG